MEIYYLVCSVCGKQLDFVESRDTDGDKMLVVDPCTKCKEGVVQKDQEGEALKRLVKFWTRV